MLGKTWNGLTSFSATVVPSWEGALGESIRWFVLRFIVYAAAVAVSGILFFVGASVYVFVVQSSLAPPSSRPDLANTPEPRTKSRPVLRAQKDVQKNVQTDARKDAKERAAKPVQQVAIGKQFVEIMRDATGVTVTIKLANTYFSPIQVVAATNEAMIYKSEVQWSRWPLVAVAGLTSCDLELECASPEAKTQRAATIPARTSFEATFKVRGDNVPEFGTDVHVSIRLETRLILNRDGDPENQSERAWLGQLYYERDVPVLDGR